MKVILLVDVKNVGKKDQVVNVADGYGRNYLLRNNLAVLADSKQLQNLADKKQANQEKYEADKLEALKLKTEIEKLSISFLVSTGEKDKVFGSISSKQITEELQKKYNIIVDKKKFVDNNPINELGTHDVKIELFKGVIATIKVVLNKK